MIQRLFRRPPTAVPQSPAVSEAVERCEHEIRAYEKRYAVTTSAPDWQTPGEVRHVEGDVCGARLICEHAVVTLTWLTPDCLRVTITQDRQDGQEPPAVFPPLRAEVATPVKCELDDGAEVVSLLTETAVCRVDKRAFKLRLELANRGLTYAELGGPAWQPGARARLSLELRRDDRICGLGIRDAAPDLRGQRAPLWNATGEGKARYTAPVIVNVTPTSAGALVWLNPARGTVDCGAGRSSELVIESEDDRLDYIICTAADAAAAVARVTTLFDPLTLPPVWALGYQHRETGVLPDALEIEQIAADYRRSLVPCDVIHFGVSLMDAGRPFTVDAERYPAARDVIDRLHEGGFAVMTDLHPAIRKDETYPTYLNGTTRSAYVKYPDGTVVHGAALPGVCAFPDFIRADVRQWWVEQMAVLVRLGIDGFIQEYAEPTILRTAGPNSLPDAAQHGDDTPVSHVQAHNLYGAQMAAATRSALEQHSPVLRHHNVITSGWMGSSAFGFGWYETEDAGWEIVRSSIRAALNGALSGIPLVGVTAKTIGADDGERFTRWLQAVALLPGLSAGRPWMHGQPYALINRLTLELRYRLLPYLYACAAQAREYGVPIIRPLWMADPANAQLSKIDDAYMIGEHLLAAPVITPDTQERRLHLPAGYWYDFWTHELHEGRQTITVPASLERLPLFVRSGTALPLWEPMQHVKSYTPEQITVRIYPGNGETALYEDHGEGTAYRHGEYRWLYFTCEWDTDMRFAVRFRVAGTNFFQTYRRMLIEIVGINTEPVEVRLDRQGAPVWYYDKGRLEVLTDGNFSRIEVEFHADPQSVTRKRRG